MRTTETPLSAEQFKEIYKSESLRNGVATAHKSVDKNGALRYYIALHRSDRYIVTDEQIREAKAEQERAKAEVIKNLGNKLVFVGMGSDYAERYTDDVCNYRIRTEITNPEGKKYFIELSRWGEELTHFDFVIDRDLEEEYSESLNFWRDKIESAGGFRRISQNHPYMINYKEFQKQPYYWNKREMWQDLKVKYTKSEVLRVVNMLFDCNFTEIEIDEYNLSPDDYRSVSPKK